MDRRAFLRRSTPLALVALVGCTDGGATHVHAFETAGEYAYHGDPHQGLGMRGSFTVE